MRRSLSVAAVVAASIATSGALSAPASAAKHAARSAETPYVGGTLDALAIGDPDYLDPNVSYSSSGALVARMISRPLYSARAIEGETTRPHADLATGMPSVSNGGKTYRVTIRDGVDWNTTPARQVTAADFVRGVKITCNPSTPFGGLPDFESLLKGMTAFCHKFSRHPRTASAIARFVENTPLPGVKATGERTIEFTLTHPASYFTAMLTMPAFSARPVEADAYLPGSTAEAQHSLSDGPYEVASYEPTKSIALTRNPAWSAATDPIRKAYVDAIHIEEGFTQSSIQDALAANQPTADVEFDAQTTYTDARMLQAQQDARLVVGRSQTSNPFLIFNTVSPNAHKALQSVVVRRAIAYALNRHALLKSFGGIGLGQPLTHVLPQGVVGSRSFDDYPHSLATAKRLLADAGHRHFKLTFLYRAVSSTNTEIAHAVQRQLGKLGITVRLLNAPGQFTIYTKYLEVPNAAKTGEWDMSIVGWGPDWYGNAAESFFKPLFDDRTLPPFSSDFGLYDSPRLDDLIDRAERATQAKAASLWAEADRQVMSDAAIYPLDDPDTTVFHAAQVHNFVLMPQFQQGDYTNMWLSPDAAS